MSEETEARVAELERMCAALKARLDEHRPTPTLKQSGLCPACGARRFLHAPKVLDSGESGQRGELSLARPSIWRSKVLGTFEAFVCTGCGWTEWYVRDPETLDELAEKMPEFKLVDLTQVSPARPYR